MSKLYFAKYLPVEGEINKHMKVLDNKGIIQTLGDSPVLSELKQKGYKPVKLFLCSRDIQVGDTYYYSNTETDICDSEVRLEQIKEQEELHGQKRFKVIGEISPSATWVKEGDEFEGDGIDFVAVVSDEDYEAARTDRVFYMIKCKCCNSFL